MTKTINPFIVSGKIPNAYFCDRDEESALLLRYLTSEENVVLMSQRRMGKTKLVEHCFDNAKMAKDHVVLSIDILHTTTFQEFIQLLGSVVFDTIARRNDRMMKLFTATLRSLSGSFGYDPVQNTPTFDIRLGDIAAPEYTLKEIFQYIEKADKRCVVVIDEFQQITKYPEKNVEALLRSHIQNLSNANFVFSGSQRRLMEEMFFSEKRPFFMSARNILLEAIPFEAYWSFVDHHFRQSGKAIEKDAVRMVYDTFLGVTLYLQRMMKDAFNMTPQGETCDSAAVERLVADYIQECDPRLREQLAFITESQKELLYAVSDEQGAVKSITSVAFVKRHRLKSSSAVQAASKKLLEYDLLTRRDGAYSIADPLMALWLKSRRF
ncbi:MAG: ATP-binding protein [Prevotella sp.]|nr:ATP-binding protein [Prevotella sp.]